MTGYFERKFAEYMYRRILHMWAVVTICQGLTTWEKGK